MTPPLFTSRRKPPAPPTKVDLVKRPASDAPTKVEPVVATKKRKQPKVKAPKRVVPVVTPEESWVMPALPRKPRLSELRDSKRRAHRALMFRSLGYLGIALIIAGVSFLLVPQVRARNTASQVVPTPSESAPAAPSAPDPFPSPTPSTSPSGTPAQPNTTQLRPEMYAPWAQSLTTKLNIPVVALQAYAWAQYTTDQTIPNCHISWTLLAGIGRAESDHGQENGARLNADGTSTPKILGPTLTSFRDTDNGVLDGDKVHERAVGPMQFIPDTWKSYASDGNADGQADPFNIYDASVASAKLLCGNNRDLRKGADWAGAVYAYNHLNSYVANVYKYTDTYARLSLS
jgi:hypothetical protein